MVAGDPGQGGAAWAVLQYVLGLSRLGHEVYLIEPLKAKSVRPAAVPLGASANAAYFRDVTRAFGLENNCSLVLEGTTETVGLPYPELRRVTKNSSAVLNISGMLERDDLIADIPIRVYLDLDPGFNQLWHAVEGIDMRFSCHTHFATVGYLLGRPECAIPTCGIPWIKTLPPVVLDHWHVTEPIQHNAFTTVANWRGYGSVEHRGVFYGQKAHSLRPLMDLPTRTTERFKLALDIHPDERNDLEALSRKGWELIDPGQAAGTPQEYRRFVSSSKAEFGLAKSGYVVSRCGWFSDRSACYLACGRPVIAQETGFRECLPCGEGLFEFGTIDEALTGIDAINADYRRHTRAARAIAAEYFDSDKVLSHLIAAVGLS